MAIKHDSSFYKRDLFEIENARNMNRDEVVQTFIPTNSFWRLLSSKNNIVLGSRGSGKTALIKMLSHNHLSKFDDPKAKRIIDSKSFIGIYITTNVEWAGSLKNKIWQSTEESEYLFQWKINIASCLGFLVTITSCLETYISDLRDRALLEREITKELCNEWLDNLVILNSLKELQHEIEKIEFRRNKLIIKNRVLNYSQSTIDEHSIAFDMESFKPLMRGIKIVSELFNFSNSTVWLLALDEAEYLEEFHHRIINSYLRSFTDNIFFKITTTPYSHHTLDTNISQPLSVGHDFDYIYIDHDPINWIESKKFDNFAKQVFNKRAVVSGDKYKGIKLNDLLGDSILLDKKKWDFNDQSSIMKLYYEYANDKTISRGEKLLSEQNNSSFMDQIGRKIHSALLLKDAVVESKGNKNLSVYSGVALAVRCGDGNPRRLIKLFNRFLLRTKIPRKNGQNTPLCKPSEQTKVLITFSQNLLSSIQSEKYYGRELYEFYKSIGEYLNKSLHSKKLGTDIISSIEIDSEISDKEWEFIKVGVELGILFPNINNNYPDQLPVKDGVFRFAYALAPAFRLLPRKGTSIKLDRITIKGNQLSLFD